MRLSRAKSESRNRAKNNRDRRTTEAAKLRARLERAQIQFGQRIKHLRRRRGLTQEELGKASGLTRASVRRLESIDPNPEIDSMLRVAEALGVTMAALFRGIG